MSDKSEIVFTPTGREKIRCTAEGKTFFYTYEMGVAMTDEDYDKIIEELEERLKAAQDDAKEAEAYAAQVEKDAKRADAIWSDNYEALKAKLAKAVQLIDDIFSDHGMDECVCEACTSYVERRAELTGGGDE